MLQLNSPAVSFSLSKCFHDTIDMDFTDALTPVSKKFKRHSDKDFDQLKQDMQTTPKMFGMRRCASYDETRKYRKMLFPVSQESDNLCHENRNISQYHEKVMGTLESMSQNDDLVGDGTNAHRLPTTTDRHKDLKYISCTTMEKLLQGDFSEKIDSYTIIDCRYPYEFEGGHIQGAVNLHTKEMIDEFISNGTKRGHGHALIFHCEFSSERGPKLLRHLRNQDRAMNAENYPELCYPEVYLLKGGYKEFFHTNKELCNPQTYTPMLHKDYSSDLRHFRSKSKSWSGGEKRKSRSIRF